MKINQEEKRKVINNKIFRYIGDWIEEKSIYLLFSQNPQKEERKEIYITALEIFLNGYSLCYIPGSNGAKIIEKAMYEVDSARLYGFLPLDLAFIKESSLMPIVVSGGGLVTLAEERESFSIELLEKTQCAAASITKATLITRPYNYLSSSLISSVLDNGKALSITPSSLSGRDMRELVREGAPLVSSFSFFLENPKYYIYPQKDGEYSIDGENYRKIRVG